MALRFPRHLGLLRDLDVGQYLVDDRPHERCDVHVRCPACGGTAEIFETHEIAADGRVFPAFVCPWETCSFHEWVVLEAWK